MLGLMNYLKNLAGSLSSEVRDTFMQSDARLSMEYIIDTLEGRRGLIREIEARHAGDSAPPEGPAPEVAAPAPALPAPPAAVPPAFSKKMAALRAASDAEEAARGKPKKKKKSDLAGMLAFMANLAGALPDPSLGKAISRKVSTVITEIKDTAAGDGDKHDQ
jgi:hypothetical protein